MARFAAARFCVRKILRGTNGSLRRRWIPTNRPISAAPAMSVPAASALDHPTSGPRTTPKTMSDSEAVIVSAPATSILPRPRMPVGHQRGARARTASPTGMLT